MLTVDDRRMRQNEKASNVLIVDDNLDILVTTARYLRDRGMNVVTASSPFGVSALVQRHRPDVIVLDVMMPALDGGNLAQLLSRQRATQGTPIILYSALSEDDLQVRARDLPLATYVPKTSGPSALATMIRSTPAR